MVNGKNRVKQNKLLVFLKVICLTVTVSLCFLLVSCSANVPPEDEQKVEPETVSRQYSFSVSRINISLDRFGNVFYAKGKWLFTDNRIMGRLTEYDPETATETQYNFYTANAEYDGDNIYYFQEPPAGIPIIEAAFELHRFNIKDSIDEIIYKVPENYMNLYQLKRSGRYLSWCDQRLDDEEGIIMYKNGGLEAMRARLKVMDLYTGTIIFDEESYVYSPYKRTDLSEDGIVFYMTRDNDSYSYHAVNIETSEEIWHKDNMASPLVFGTISDKYVAYCYTTGDVGIDWLFKVESRKDGKEVYSAGGIRSAVISDDCLVTGFSGGFQLIDLTTGKRTMTCRDVEELAPARYIYTGWIYQIDDSHFYFVREDPQRESIQDEYGGKARDAFIATLQYH